MTKQDLCKHLLIFLCLLDIYLHDTGSEINIIQQLLKRSTFFYELEVVCLKKSCFPICTSKVVRESAKTV